MNNTIVFIHIGPKLPEYLGIALQQARLFNPKSRIILLASAPAIILTPLSRKLQVEVVPCESLKLSHKHQNFLASSNLDKEFRAGFWLHTTERFFYLENLMLQLELNNVIHLENDILLYTEIESQLPTLKSYYPGIAATFDAPKRCVPGFFYVGDLRALSLFTEFATDFARQNKTRYNDMTLLGLFKQRNNPATIAALPIVASTYPHPLTNLIGCPPQKFEDYANHFNEFNSIFDAAAIGQYLGGVDPANDSEKRDTSGFINETSVFNPSVYEYRWTFDHKNRRVPVAIDGETLIKINNLHIHSKNLGVFSSNKM